MTEKWDENFLWSFCKKNIFVLKHVFTWCQFCVLNPVSLEIHKIVHGCKISSRYTDDNFSLGQKHENGSMPVGA